MTRTVFAAMIAVPVFAIAVCTHGAQEKTHKITTVSTRKMADSLHAVIAADQQAYAGLVALRLNAKGLPNENGKNSPEDIGLPDHAQLLRTASQNIQKGGAEFSYTLRSLSPINGNNGPQTQVEQIGLETVAKNPKEAFYIEEELGGRSYFTAIYAERATSASCIDCHNKHPRSPRRDIKVGDVMGAIVVRVPLEF